MLAPPRQDETRLVQGAALVLGAAMLACAGLRPLLLPVLLLALVAGAVLFLAWRHLTGFCVAWLLITGATLEMTLTDMIGPQAFQPAIAAIKGSQIVLATLCALRWGGRADLFNPALAFVLMTLFGFAHGLHRDLGPGDSLRSLAGSIAPFAFCFCRPPESWANAIIRAVCWAPPTAVAGAVALAIPGIRPLFIDSGGERLAGLGHPAFLAGVCLSAVYACLSELYRHGRPRDGALLAANLTILILTGARAPLFYGLAVTGLTLAVARSSVLRRRVQVLTVLAAGTILPLILAGASEFASVRLFNLLLDDPGNLSGREYLWPIFQAAADESPWFGWGVGAGNTIIPPEGTIARLLRTWAAHNEWLRLQVEGGRIGLALLVTLFTVWVWRRTRPIDRVDRLIMRLAYVALALHAITDNVLISTPMCVLVTLAAALFSRARSALPDSPKRA